MDLFDLTTGRERLRLAADCANCFGLCCVAHAFRASASFAFDKLAGEPCPNLLEDFGCAVHRTLRQQGFSGCTAYTCYGAGQKVSQDMFGGNDWRQAPETADLMFQTFPAVRQLNQLMWFVTEALARCAPGPEHTELLVLLDETERLGAARADEMSWGDVDRHCLIGETLLGRVSAGIRAAALPVQRPAVRSAPGDLPEVLRHELDLRGDGWRRRDLHGVDLRGADLRGADLRGADLRCADLGGVDLWGAVLADADLSDADLRWADLMGADLGRANLAGTDLSAAIFLTQSQLELAYGNRRTTLSAPLQTPAHWSEAGESPVSPTMPVTFQDHRQAHDRWRLRRPRRDSSTDPARRAAPRRPVHRHSADATSLLVAVKPKIVRTSPGDRSLPGLESSPPPSGDQSPPARTTSCGTGRRGGACPSVGGSARVPHRPPNTRCVLPKNGSPVTSTVCFAAAASRSMAKERTAPFCSVNEPVRSSPVILSPVRLA